MSVFYQTYPPRKNLPKSTKIYQNLVPLGEDPHSPWLPLPLVLASLGLRRIGLGCWPPRPEPDSAANHVQRHVTSHHVTLRHATSCHTTSHHITLRSVAVHNVTPRHTTSRHVTSYHVTSRHTTSYHTTSGHVTSHRHKVKLVVKAPVRGPTACRGKPRALGKLSICTWPAMSMTSVYKLLTPQRYHFIRAAVMC